MDFICCSRNGSRGRCFSSSDTAGSASALRRWSHSATDAKHSTQLVFSSGILSFTIFQQAHGRDTIEQSWFIPLTPTVAIWVQLKSIFCQTGWAIICNFWHPGTLMLGAECQECLDVKNYKWQLNPVWHRMFYSCAHITTVGVKGLMCRLSHYKLFYGQSWSPPVLPGKAAK